jgi:hypothetical protein
MQEEASAEENTDGEEPMRRESCLHCHCSVQGTVGSATQFSTGGFPRSGQVWE